MSAGRERVITDHGPAAAVTRREAERTRSEEAGGEAPGRDRSIDTLRVVAMAGVVLGHWLVTGLVLTPDGLRTASPLAAMPELAPISWLFQTLGLFFFAGGFVAVHRLGTRRTQAAREGAARSSRGTDAVGAARSSRGTDAVGAARSSRGTDAVGDARGAVGRSRRVVRAALVFVAVWTAVVAGGAAAGVSGSTLHTAWSLASSPLWFLGPYLLLRWGAPLIQRAGVGPALAVVVASDVAQVVDPGARGSVVLGGVSVVAAWAVPWWLGGAVAAGRAGGRRHGALLAAGGAAVLMLLVTVGGYPVSAVGVPGDGRSNLDPPSLVAVALAVTQIGVFLLVRPWAGRAWRLVPALNRAALRVYLGHQSVLLVTALVTVRFGVPGLVGAPAGAEWVAARIAWLPVLMLILVAVAASSTSRDPLRYALFAWRSTRRGG